MRDQFTRENYAKLADHAKRSVRMRPQRENTYVPSDFDSQAEFLVHVVKTFNDDVTADYNNIQAALEDAGFVTGQQWDPIIEANRNADQKPVLTINTAPALIGQVIGNRLANETAIDVVPDMGGTVQVAKIRKGLIRSIQKNSDADFAYNTAMQNQVIGGGGNFRLGAKYARADVFEQDLCVEAIPNPQAVVWDRMSVETTGRDARHVFVQDLMLRSTFDANWPWAQPGELGSALAYTQMLQTNGWMTTDTVRVVDFWRLREVERTLAMMTDGSVADVTDLPEEDWLGNVQQHPQTGMPMIRETCRTYAEMVKCSATNVLEGPYRYWIDRVPVFRVSGWVVNVGDTVHRFGLIRFAKDPMRFRNYWRSVEAEKLMQTPNATWLATKESVEGYEDLYRNSNRLNDPLLVWNGETGQRPERIQPAQMEAALFQAAAQSEQDIRNVTNLHEASLGQQSNEVSGKAITARVRVGELGMVIYQDHLNRAIAEAGRVLNDLIPYYYDTPRTIKVMGDDGVTELVPINNPDDPKSIDITVGKYAVSLITGPSYTTKRIEAVETIEAIINAHPETMAIAGDILFRNMDIPGAEELAERFAKTLPPNIRSQDDMSEEEQKGQQQAMQVQQQQMQLQQDMLEAQIAEQRAKVDLLAAQVAEAQARAALLQQQTAQQAALTGRTAAEIERTEAETEKTFREADATEAEKPTEEPTNDD